MSANENTCRRHSWCVGKETKPEKPNFHLSLGVEYVVRMLAFCQILKLTCTFAICFQIAGCERNLCSSGILKILSKDVLSKPPQSFVGLYGKYAWETRLSNINLYRWCSTIF